MLLSCSQLHGHHNAGKKISDFEKIITCYEVSDKLYKIVTDNDSNVRKAFSKAVNSEEDEYTVEPLLKDSPNKGHHINYLPTLFKAPKIDFPIVLIHFSPLKVDNLSTVDKFAGPNVSFLKRAHCIEKEDNFDDSCNPSDHHHLLHPENEDEGDDELKIPQIMHTS